jgi:glyoxylase I family protein
MRKGETMGIVLHHVNLSTKNTEAMAAFYRDVVGLKQSKELGEKRIYNQYTGQTTFLLSDQGEIHVAESNPDLCFQTGQAVNPLIRGHFAFRVDNIEEAKERLRNAKIPFSDPGQWAMQGWHQIFFHDPDGNVIEIHQIVED